MEKMQYPPGSRRVSCGDEIIVAMAYSKDIVLIIKNNQIFAIKKCARGFKIIPRTMFVRVVAMVPDSITPEQTLAWLYNKDFTDALSRELHFALPQPIAEEIEEYIGWAPFKELPKFRI